MRGERNGRHPAATLNACFQGSGFRVQGSGFRVQGVLGAGIRVQGVDFRGVQGLGFRV